MKKILGTLNKFDIILYSSGVICSILGFIIFKNTEYLNLINTILGLTALIFIAKGNPFGQILMIIFSVLYGIISFSFSYFGEMITYLGMTMPMAVFALVAWLRNPYKDNKSEVKVNSISVKETALLLLLAVFVTNIFYFILDYFNTANMFFSTLSVSTSFIAAYLTFRRSPYFALAYAANDVVLIILWTMASFIKTSYISVVICFVVFLINDLYGFISWLKMEKRQKN